MHILNLNLKNIISKISFSDSYKVFQNLAKPFKSSFKFWTGPVLYVVVRDPVDIKIAMNAEESLDKIALFYKQYISFCLFSMDNGEHYKLHRKMITPLFSASSLQRCMLTLNRKVENFFERFDKTLDPRKEIEFSHLTMDYVFDTILATMVGIDNVSDERRMKFVVDTEK